MATSSLKDVVRKVIFDQLSKIPRDASSVLITDVASEKILSSARCTYEELQSLGIRETASILTKRVPRPTWFGVYFLSPQKDSVKRLVADFVGSDSEKKYEAAFVFFTSALEDEGFQFMQRSGLINHVKELIELEIAFTPRESRVFHIGYEHAAERIYTAPNPAKLDSLLGGMAKKIRAVLATLNEDPLIRYHDPLGDGSSLPCLLARKLNDSMKDLKSFDKTFPLPTPYDDQGPATVLIVDRSVDLISPLLHTLAFECLVWDLFEAEETEVQGLNRFVVNVESDTGVNQAIVDESDDLYSSIRHLFFTKGFEEVDRQLQEYAKLIDSHTKSDKKAGDSVEKIKDAVMNLPENLRKKAQIDALVNLSTDIKDTVLKRKLKELSFLEQTLAVGEDDEGEAPTKLMKQFEEIMADDIIQSDDKLRLLLLYILAGDGLSPDAIDRLAEMAGIEADDLTAIQGLQYFGAKVGDQKPSPFTKQARRRALEAALGRGKGSGDSRVAGVDFTDLLKRLKLGGNSSGDAVKSALDEEGFLDPDFRTYDRYQPAITYVLQDHILGRLNTSRGAGGEFPFIEDPSLRNKGSGHSSPLRPAGDDSRGPGVIVDLPQTTDAMGRFKWGMSRPKVIGTDDYRINGPRTILFVIGGLSYTEIRAVYLLAKKMQREIYIGSTSVLEPTELVATLEYLGKSGPPPQNMKALPSPPEVQAEQGRSPPIETDGPSKRASVSFLGPIQPQVISPESPQVPDPSPTSALVPPPVPPRDPYPQKPTGSLNTTQPDRFEPSPAPSHRVSHQNLGNLASSTNNLVSKVGGVLSDSMNQSVSHIRDFAKKFHGQSGSLPNLPDRPSTPSSVASVPAKVSGTSYSASSVHAASASTNVNFAPSKPYVNDAPSAGPVPSMATTYPTPLSVAQTSRPPKKDDRPSATTGTAEPPSDEPVKKPRPPRGSSLKDVQGVTSQNSTESPVRSEPPAADVQSSSSSPPSPKAPSVRITNPYMTAPVSSPPSASVSSARPEPTPSSARPWVNSAPSPYSSAHSAASSPPSLGYAPPMAVPPTADPTAAYYAQQYYQRPVTPSGSYPVAQGYVVPSAYGAAPGRHYSGPAPSLNVPAGYPGRSPSPGPPGHRSPLVGTVPMAPQLSNTSSGTSAAAFNPYSNASNVYTATRPTTYVQQQQPYYGNYQQQARPAPAPPLPPTGQPAMMAYTQGQSYGAPSFQQQYAQHPQYQQYANAQSYQPYLQQPQPQWQPRPPSS
ncbi:Sec1-like protein [Zopfochytrium polystomum]|nr:Sec1-like protein [Zopfochytrium polystomum]